MKRLFRPLVPLTFLLLLGSPVAFAAGPDVAALIPAEAVQKFVTGSTVVVKGEPGRKDKVAYVDKQYPTMPMATIRILPSKNPAADLKGEVATATKFMGLTAAPVKGIGDEAFHEPSFNTLYFRKGGAVVIVGAAKDAGAIKVDLMGLGKMIAGKL
ncbi:MAG: hypothetical protein HQK87_08660 [Nitrospinae bacterium]|nr:hypothetical protein [Nitrospinota bacterium]